jgi:GNAT superfamily N-acetyltransferase
MRYIRKTPKIHFRLASEITDPSLKHQLNLTASIAFGHGGDSPNDNVANVASNGGYVAYILVDGMKVASVGFGNLTEESYWLHTFGTLEEYRGQGFCTAIIKKFVQKMGKKYVLYLTVRTAPGDENHAAIKCYKKCGFVMLPEVYRDHYDGRNSAMVKLPTQNLIRRTRRKPKTKKRKRRTRRRRKRGPSIPH